MTNLSSALRFPSFAGFIIFITLAVCLPDFPETEGALGFEKDADDLDSDGYAYEDDYDHSNTKRNENEKDSAEKAEKKVGDSKNEDKGAKSAGEAKLNEEKASSAGEETKEKEGKAEKAKETSAVVENKDKEANLKSEKVAKEENKVAEEKVEKVAAAEKDSKAGLDQKNSDSLIKKEETGNFREREKEDSVNKVAEEKSNAKDSVKLSGGETTKSRFKGEESKKSNFQEETEETDDVKEPLRMDLPQVELKDTDYHKNYLKSLNRFNNRNEAAADDDSELSQLILKSIMNAYDDTKVRNKRKNKKIQTKRSFLDALKQAESGKRQRKSPKTLEFKIQIIDQNEAKNKNVRSIGKKKGKRNEEIVYAPSKSSFDEKEEEPKTLVLVKKKQNGEKMMKTFIDGTCSKCQEKDLTSEDLAKLLSQKKDYVVLKKVPSSNEYKVLGGEADYEDKAQAEEPTRPERKQKMKFVSADEDYSNSYDEGEIAKVHTKGFKSVDKKLHAQEEPSGLGDFFKDEKKDDKDPNCQSEAEKEIVYLDETKKSKQEDKPAKEEDKESLAKQNREKAQRLQNEKEVIVFDRQKIGKTRFQGPQINGQYPQKYVVLEDGLGLNSKHQLKIIKNDNIIPNDRIYELDRQVQKSHHPGKNRYYGQTPVYAVVRPAGGKKAKENRKRNSDDKDFFDDNEITGNFNKFLKDFQQLTEEDSNAQRSPEKDQATVTKDQIRQIKSYGDESLQNINRLLKDLLNDQKEKNDEEYDEVQESRNTKNKRSYILPAETEETVLENQIQQILKNLKSSRTEKSRKKRDAEEIKNIFNSNSTSRKLLSIDENIDPNILELFGKADKKRKREIDPEESSPSHWNDLLETSFIGTGNEKREVVKKDEPVWESNEGNHDSENGGNQVVEKRDIFDDNVNFYDSEMMSNDWDGRFRQKHFRRRESPAKSRRSGKEGNKKAKDKNEQFTMDKKTFEDMVKKYLESGSGTVAKNEESVAAGNSDVIYQSIPQPTYSKTIDFYKDDKPKTKGKEPIKTKTDDLNDDDDDVQVPFQIPGQKSKPSDSEPSKSFNLKEIGKKLQDLLETKTGYFQKGLEDSMVRFEQPDSAKGKDSDLENEEEEEEESEEENEDEVGPQYLYLKNRRNGGNLPRARFRGVQKKHAYRSASKTEEKKSDDEDNLGDDVIQNVIGGYILRKSAKIHPEESLNFNRLTEDGKSRKATNIAESKKTRKRLSPGHLTESHFRKFHRKNNAKKREDRIKRYQRNGPTANADKTKNNIRITITSEDEPNRENRRKRFDFSKEVDGFERVVSDPKSVNRQTWRSADALSAQSGKESEGPLKVDLNDFQTHGKAKHETRGSDVETYLLLGKKKRSVDRESPSREVSNHLYKLPIKNRAAERESEVPRKNLLVTKSGMSCDDSKDEQTCPCPNANVKIPQLPKDQDPSNEELARKTGQQIVDCVFANANMNPKFKETIWPGLCGKRERLPNKEPTCPASKKDFEEKICPILKKLKTDLVKVAEENGKEPPCCKPDKHLSKFLRGMIGKSDKSGPAEPFHDQNKFSFGNLLENSCKVDSKDKTSPSEEVVSSVQVEKSQAEPVDRSSNKAAPIKEIGRSKIAGDVNRYKIVHSGNPVKAAPMLVPQVPQVQQDQQVLRDIMQVPKAANTDSDDLYKKRCYLLKLIEDYRRLSIPEKTKAEPLYKFLMSRLSDTNQALGLAAEDATTHRAQCRNFKKSLKLKHTGNSKAEISKNHAAVLSSKTGNRAKYKQPTSDNRANPEKISKLKSADQKSETVQKEAQLMHSNRKQKTQADKELHKLGLGDAAALQLALGQKPWFSNLDVTKGVPNFIPLPQKSAGNSQFEYKRPQLSQS